MKTPLLVLLLALPASAREMSPSFGVRYSQLNLQSPNGDTQNTIQGWNEKSYIADLNWPISSSIDLNFSAGKTIAVIDSWDRQFALNTIIADGYGNFVGIYGPAIVKGRRGVLEGYNLSASARYYFR